MTSDASALAAVAALSDDLRRHMYDFIRRSDRPVTRDEAAESVGISRKLAAFHLDKLVDAGLLSARYAQPGGLARVGRAPKVYEPSGIDVQVSIPQREHELLAGILLDAARTQTAEENGPQAALRVARERGLALAEAERAHTRPGRLGAERALTHAGQILERYGFEPARDTPTLVRLRNCPFHPLEAAASELVCGINHAFLSGFLDGLAASSVTAVLAPRPGACCVELTAAADLPAAVAPPGCDR